MKKDTIDFLKKQIADAQSANNSVNNWLNNGKWSRQVKAFLKNWLSNDIELERNGRTNTQMACDLVEELKQMRQRNEMRIFVANWYLETGKTPVEFAEPLLRMMDFETAVDNAISAITTSGKVKFGKYLENRRRIVKTAK